ncbi:MAG: LysR substrate-binding domain-containing protein [Pseudomonadota bacterium]
MRNLYNSIHSPTALLAFEAAARLGSFTLAAQELNVTQPAISSSVKKLEQALGVRLFSRKNRQIILTEPGERFYTDVSFGLMHILRSAQSISARTISRHVTLNCSTAFAHYWIVPRLADFRSEYPDIDLRLQTTDRDVAIDADGATLLVWRGLGEIAGYESEFLQSEQIYPIATPGFIEQYGSVETIDELARAPLLHLDEPYRLRPTWTDWFAEQEFEYRETGGGLRFNDYALVLQACFAGEGIATGWNHVVERFVKRGTLQRLTDGVYDIGYGFYVSWPSSSALSEDAASVIQWLKKQSVTKMT